MRKRHDDRVFVRPDWRFVPSKLWWHRDPFVLHYDLVLHPTHR